MKHFAKHSLRSVLLCVFSVFLIQESFSQVTVAQWNFDASTSVPTTTATNVTAFNVQYGSGITATATYPGGNPSTGKAISNTGWNVTSIDLTKYLEIRLSPNTNYAINFNDFKFDALRSATGAASWAIRSSSDNFTTNITTGTVGTAFTTNTISLTSASFQNTNSEFKIRIYGYAATGIGGTFRIDNITFSGTVGSTIPTLTATPTSITNLNYTGSGPSTASSYTLSGSVLTPMAGDITLTAPADFEISKTSATTGFADNLTVSYTGGAFPNNTIYVRLKAGLVVGTSGPLNITHSGGGTNTNVAVSGSVTSVPPPVITTTGTLSTFYTIVGTPSASQSYTVSGVNLVSDITITAPTNFEIKTGAGAYANSLTLLQSSGSVPTTMIDVRLKGTTVGSFTGQNITNVSTTASVNTSVTGTVGASCGVATDIATVRALVPPVASNTGGTTNYIVTGTVTGIFGVSKFYVQDATGGIAVFSTSVVSNNNLAVGDQVTLSGIPVRFNGEAQINGPIITITPLTRGQIPCITKITTGAALAPLVFNANTPPSGINLPTFLDNNEGKLVKVISTNISSTGTFTGGTTGTNYPITACNLQGDAEIRIDVTATTIVSQPIPTVSQDITGVVGNYINASGTVNILQLFPRTIADFSNSSVACVTPVASPSASCGPLGSQSIVADSTLDVTCWNVEWLGNTTTSPSALGPTNDAQQMTNVLQVLNTVKSDIFCIEEVCDHKQFIARVKTDMPKYKTRCQTKYYSHFFDSPETLSATTFSQKVCFVYDSTVVTMVDTVSLLSDVYTFPANNWASGRLPFLFIGDVKVGGITKQIHFVGLHAKSGSAVADYNRRKQDIIDLKAKLDTGYPNANIILLGDYNDDLDTSIAAGKASSYANFVNDNINYKQISRALSDCKVSSTAKYPDIIDHFLMSNEFGVLPSSGATPSPSLSGIYYLEKTINVSRPISYVTNYTTTTSDHYPVNARFTFKLPLEIVSINSGNWSLPSTWNCNCVPSSSSNVTIDSAHTVTVDVPSQVRSLNVKGTVNWVASIMLSLGQ